jgi:hypothetical protein
LRNASGVEDNAYKTLVFVYSRELDVIVSTSSIIKCYVEKESSPPYSEDVVMDLEKEMMNMEDSTPMATPQSVMGSNKLNEPPMEPNLAQYVRKRVWQHI